MCEAEQLEFTEDNMLNLKQNLERIISNVCKSQNVDKKYVHYNTIEDGYSVWICEPTNFKDTFRSFNIRIKGKKDPKYVVEIIYKRIHNVPTPKDIQVDTVNKSNIVFPLNHSELFDYLSKVLDYDLKNFEPADKIGCCGKYNECSNAKRCLYTDLFYARVCQYKKNLESGKIFYGENRNVD